MIDPETFARLESEVAAWSEEQFPGQPAVNPLLGMAEEAGELRETLATPPDDLELDAVGDLLVYAADFATRRGLNYAAAARLAADGPRVPGLDDASHDLAAEEPRAGLQIAYGHLARSVLKRRQDIRTDEDRVGTDAETAALALWLASLARLADARGYRLDEAVRAAWDDEVVDREWESAYGE